MPEIDENTTLQEALIEISQGNPGAVSVLSDLKSSFSKNDWIRMISLLYEHGPRGTHLWTNFKECNEDVDILGRNLKARIEEWNQDAWEV